MDVREKTASKKRMIDANALFEKLKKTSRYFTVKFDIDEAPTVDAVEVVHGRWIDRPRTKGQVYCSECATIEKSTDSNYKSRRCPNCGAKMDGGSE